MQFKDKNELITCILCVADSIEKKGKKGEEKKELLPVGTSEAIKATNVRTYYYDPSKKLLSTGLYIQACHCPSWHSTVLIS